MDPVINEIRRAQTPIREDVLRRWAQYLVTQVQPILDEAEALRAQAATKVGVEARRKVSA